jgi:DNA modification methylase
MQSVSEETRGPAVTDEASGDDWQMYCGDCVQVTRGLPEGSMDLSIHSPPFSNLYIYSDSEADMGNSATDAEFFDHYRFLIDELYRVTVTGRIAVVHCKDLPKYANRDETAGLKDFPGQIITAFEAAGWSYHSRVTIWKCPVVERERTNNNGLLHKTALRDRSQLRQGMADYLLMFRKPPAGTLLSDKPICEEDGFAEFVGLGEYDPRNSDKHKSPFARGRGKKSGGFHELQSSIHVWRRYAEPVWWDVDQMDVLNYRHAKSDKDERHICPLQLGLIERCVHIWSLPGEVVFSPFAGIGSEGVGAIRQGRRFVGVELKAEYFREAKKNLRKASKRRKTVELPLFGGEDTMRNDIEFGRGTACPVAEVRG